MRHSTTFASILLSASTCTASMFAKRDSWGPAFSLGPAKAGIVSTSTTIYPGAMPADQAGYLFVWLGISNGTGDLIQSVIGSYPKGQSQCTGLNADTAWCVSSEVYGLADNGYPNQWVGELETADPNYTNGIILNYTLIDKSSYLWAQTMTDAVTGRLLSSFQKTSGPMLGWGTAIECNDYNGVACTGTVSEQSYVNSTIILESADSTFVQTLGAGTGVTHTDMVTTDGGKTWTIGKINIPAMQSGTAAVAADPTALDSSSSVASNVKVTASTPLKVAMTSTSSLSSIPSSFSSVTASVSPKVTPTGAASVPTYSAGSAYGTGSTGKGSGESTGGCGGYFPGSAQPSASFGRSRGGKWGGFGKRA